MTILIVKDCVTESLYIVFAALIYTYTKLIDSSLFETKKKQATVSMVMVEIPFVTYDLTWIR